MNSTIRPPANQEADEIFEKHARLELEALHANGVSLGENKIKNSINAYVFFSSIIGMYTSYMTGVLVDYFYGRYIPAFFVVGFAAFACGCIAFILGSLKYSPEKSRLEADRQLLIGALVASRKLQKR